MIQVGFYCENQFEDQMSKWEQPNIVNNPLMNKGKHHLENTS
jgi:hypothetical protein